MNRETGCGARSRSAGDKRNIVPLMLEGFDFGTPAIANQLTGKLAALKRYNALSSGEYFMAAMDRLRERT